MLSDGRATNVALVIVPSFQMFFAYILSLVVYYLGKDNFKEARNKEAKVLKSNGFNSEMIKEAVAITKVAFEKNNSAVAVTRKISTDFKDKFGGNYSCIVSTSDYDLNVKPNNNYVHLFLGVFRVEIFSTAPPPPR